MRRKMLYYRPLLCYDGYVWKDEPVTAGEVRRREK